MSMRNYLPSLQIIIVITGAILSSLSGWLMYATEEKLIISEFRKEVDEHATSLYSEIAVNFEALRSLAVLFSAGNVPELKRFSFEAKKILHRYPAIQALEWAPHVTHSERKKYESTLQRNFPGFKITERKEQGKMIPAEQRSDYFPVHYIEPLIGNEAAFGFDLASNPTRLGTIEKSRNTSKPMATASIILVQNPGKQKGFLAFIPIYKGLTSTLEKRHKNHKGFVVGAYRFSGIIANSSLVYADLGIEIKLIDETLSPKHDTLHVSEKPNSTTVNKNISYSKKLPELWGRKWCLNASPKFSYITSRRSAWPEIIFASGILFTFLISLYTSLLSRHTAIIEKQTNALNKANYKLEILSYTDGLTGVSNRRMMDKFLDNEWRRAIRNESYLSFILVDIDFFKLYNDNYGHQKGDECLKKVAAALNKNLVRRPGDLVARYGGEEFALILTNAKHADIVANNCRQVIEDLHIPHDHSKVADVVTISVGLCIMNPRKGMDPSLLIRQADEALYVAKASGRNRVEKFTLNTKSHT